MSANARFSSYARKTTDHAVSHAYACLAGEERASFTELLDAVRRRTTVRMCPPVVAALHNVARFAPHHVRPLAEWKGGGGAMYPVVHALVQHLLAVHEVPRFLASVWYGDASASADVKRRWFIAHAAGTRFRELDLPLSMTRRMESVFLRSPDHLSVEAAMRRAELLALGATDALVKAVLATRLGSELANGAFWRTVMEFFVRASERLAPGVVGPIIDFVQYVRHERVEVITDNGVQFVDPPTHAFPSRGARSPRCSVSSRAARGLGAKSGSALSWTRSRFRPLMLADPPAEPDRPPVRWELVELASSAQLRAEGKALRHCVASYARRCQWGLCEILVSSAGLGASTSFRSVATIEVDPRARAIVQARGMRNGRISARARDLVGQWARRENLALRV